MYRLLTTVGALLLSVTDANIYYQDKKWEAAHGREKRDTAAKRRKENGEHLEVHIFPHTHDDVGWLKTVDQYYSGSDQADQHAEVNLILSTVIPELMLNKNRKFTYVEIKFFSMWWTRQTNETQQDVRDLIGEGRFEFVNGGWSMHDEASPHYEDMINNMWHGHEWLKNMFNVIPKIGWHVDPFGHSTANPRLFHDMGFEAWFFARLDYADSANRKNNQEMNYLWRPMSEHFGNDKQIFTSAMRDHYCWISGFWYDERFDGDDPFVTDMTLDTFNAPEKVALLVQYITEWAEDYRGNQVYMPFGCDFTFANAKMNFQFMDNMIDYFNEHNDANMTMFYSTPGQYIDALKKENITWPTNYDDMFPYADNPQGYWSGYFSSR